MLGINEDILENIINRANIYLEDCENLLESLSHKFYNLSVCCSDKCLQDLVVDSDVEKNKMTRISTVLNNEISILKMVKKSYDEQDSLMFSQLNQLIAGKRR